MGPGHRAAPRARSGPIVGARIGLISPCGWGNLGDAAIQDSALQGIRRHLGPEATVRAFTLAPADTTRRHGVPADTLIGYSIPGTYGVQGEPAVHDTLRVVKSESTHLGRSWRAVGALDLLLASGGGQIDEEWGGPWGHPYALYRWSLLAAMRRVPFAVLSTGTGRLDSRLGRRMVRGALRRAVYRSFRDEGSRRLALPAGAAPDDPVVPDLAFGLEVASRVPGPTAAGSLVGIAPMVFENPRHWPVKNESAYAAYVRRLAGVLEALAAAGRRYRWLISDRADQSAVDDVRSALGPAARGAEDLRPPVSDVAGLVAALQEVRVLVASRLHAILLAYVTGTPAVGLSYDRKVDALMDEFEQSAFRMDIRAFTPAEVAAGVARLSDERDARASVITARAARAREAVDRQYARVFALARPARS